MKTAWTVVAIIACSSLCASTSEVTHAGWVEETAAETTPIVADCRTDKGTTPIVIDFENKSGKEVRIRGCQNQYACKPYKDCVVGMADGASAAVTLDSSFKYFVMTYHEDARDTELYPDANLKYPTEYDIEAPTSAVVVAESAKAASGTDCRTDTTSTPIVIDFENKSGKEVRIRGCQNQYACKPYKDCVVGMADGASAAVTLDSSFKYFVMTYHEDARDTELYPDANLKYPTEYDIEAPTSAVVQIDNVVPVSVM